MDRTRNTIQEEICAAMNKDHPFSLCNECHQDKFRCTCNIKKHIFTVTYHLVVETGPTGVWCQEKVRVIAYDIIHAREQVREWLAATDKIWFVRKNEVIDHVLPKGPRDITIVTAEMYLEDVGAALKSNPLPNIMPPED